MSEASKGDERREEYDFTPEMLRQGVRGVVAGGVHTCVRTQPRLTKGRTERRAKRLCALEWQCVRNPCKWSCCWRVGVMPRE
jgi:hypothetical protein